MSRSIIELESQVKKALADLGLGSLPLPKSRVFVWTRLAGNVFRNWIVYARAPNPDFGGFRKQLEEKRVMQKQGRAKLDALPVPPDVDFSSKASWDRLPDKTIDQKLRRADSTVRELNGQMERLPGHTPLSHRSSAGAGDHSAARGSDPTIYRK